MDSLQYLNDLKSSMEGYFDIFENYKIGNVILPLYSKSIVRNERYFVSKKLVTDAYNNYEHCFIQINNEYVNKEDINRFIDLLKSTVDKTVIPNEEHMSTIISGIYITNRVFSSESIEKAKKFKFHKTFSFGFKGWCDIHLILVELNNNIIYTNKSGKVVKSFYESILNKGNNLLK